MFSRFIFNFGGHNTTRISGNTDSIWKIPFFCYFRSLAVILEKGLTVEEAIDIAFVEDDEINDSLETIYIAPPDPATLTAEDSGDEDEGRNVDNLSRCQLLVDAEVRIAKGTTLELQSQESDVT